MTVPLDPDPVTVKTFTLRVETPEGALPLAEIQIPDIPLGLADLAPPILNLCNGIVDVASRAATRAGKTVRCGPGCGICCRQLVPLSPPEAFFIVDTVLSSSNEHATLFRQRFSDIQSALMADGLWERLTTIDRSENFVAIAEEFWNRQIPCPFLIDESCGIHAIRPCACREYSVTSDPTLCANPFRGGIERIKISRKMTTALAKTAANLLATTPQLIPLVLIVEWCNEHRDLGERRWMGIGLFDLLLEIALK
jgi:Fe-S-cluster containining protein